VHGGLDFALPATACAPDHIPLKKLSAGLEGPSKRIDPLGDVVSHPVDVGVDFLPVGSVVLSVLPVQLLEAVTSAQLAGVTLAMEFSAATVGLPSAVGSGSYLLIRFGFDFLRVRSNQMSLKAAPVNSCDGD